MIPLPSLWDMTIKVKTIKSLTLKWHERKIITKTMANSIFPPSLCIIFTWFFGLRATSFHCRKFHMIKFRLKRNISTKFLLIYYKFLLCSGPGLSGSKSYCRPRLYSYSFHIFIKWNQIFKIDFVFITMCPYFDL